MKYDYLVVGAGLFGAAFAYQKTHDGYKCLVIDRRNHLGGNTYCENIEGIQVHRYGPHIFHTDDKEVWDFVNQFVQFNDYIHMPLANYHGELYHMPFNMNTFAALWPDVKTADDAKKKIEEQVKQYGVANPTNLQQQAIALVGKDVYEKLIKGYTEKQWGRSCEELPPSIIQRIPVRYTFDNNYFNDRYQGIPVGGYNSLVEKLLENCDIQLGVDYLQNREHLNSLADKVLYTGMIDEFYDYCFGCLEYRSLEFETTVLYDCSNYQNCSVVNYTDSETPFTRIIEHKHFEDNDSPITIITKEYPAPYQKGREAYYPVNDEKNNALYQKYRQLAAQDEKVVFGGRLGNYQYYDMDDTIKAALKLAKL